MRCLLKITKEVVEVIQRIEVMLLMIDVMILLRLH